MITYINKIQKDAEFIRKHDATSIVSISAIEYCYYKISTIWDIAYHQIADKLIFPTKKMATNMITLKIISSNMHRNFQI